MPRTKMWLAVLAAGGSTVGAAVALSNAPAASSAPKLTTAALASVTPGETSHGSPLDAVVSQADQLQAMITQLQKQLGTGPVTLPGSVSYVVERVGSGGASAGTVAGLKAWQAQLTAQQGRLAAESSALTSEHQTLVADAAELQAEQQQIAAEQQRLTQTTTAGGKPTATSPVTTIPPVTTPTTPTTTATTIPTTSTTTGASGGGHGGDN